VTTFTNLKVRAASRFRDTANAVYSDVEWGGYVNDAYRWITLSHHDWPWMVQLNASLLTFTPNTQAMALPVDVFAVRSIFNVTDNYLIRPRGNTESHLFEYTPLTDVGYPDLYRIRNNSVELYPAPDHTVVLRIEYVAPPVDMSAGADVPAFPAQYHMVIVEGALALGYEDDGAAEEHDRHWQKFIDQVDKMYHAMMAGQMSSYGEISDTFFTSEMSN